MLWPGEGKNNTENYCAINNVDTFDVVVTERHPQHVLQALQVSSFEALHKVTEV